MRYPFNIISFVLCVFISLILSGFGCRENTVDLDITDKTEFLTAEDIGVTDTYLKITLPFSLRQQPVILKRDTTTIIHSYISANDTLIYDEHLLPNHTYTYTLTIFSGRTFSSDAHLIITTMDTTSHNFTWTIDTLGDGNSSILYDVAIINDTLAYAVGEINVKDSLGNWINPPYNMAQWNGKKWKLSTVLYQGGYAPIKFIFALSDDDIWLGMGYLVHWNGERYISIEVPPFYGVSPNKMWCSQSGLMYVVGNNGTIAYSTNQGTSWEKLESGTDVNLTDVWGTSDGNNVWACGWEDLKPTVLLKIHYNIVENIYEDHDHRGIVRGDTLSGILVCGMVKENNLFIYSLTGVYQIPFFHTDFVHRLSFTSSIFSTMPQSIDGNGSNDFTIAGYSSFLAHFNGLSWHQYDEIWRSNRYLRSVAQKGNLVIAVGVNYDPSNSTGSILIGNR